MKKALSVFLMMCLLLCLLCSCGTADKKEESGDKGGNKDNPDTAITVDPTAKELLGGYHYVSTDKSGDQNDTEEVITSIEWTANGAVMTGYEQQSDGDRSDLRMEVTFDAEKRPATLVRTVTDGEESEENRMRFEYPAERTVKMINSGFGDGESYVIYEYDEKGNRIREEYPNYTYVYTYDDHGNCISKKTEYVADDQEDRESTATYTYDDDGKIVTAVEINSAGKETQTRYFYYPNGNVMMKMSVSDSGNVNYNFCPYNPKDGLAWSYGMSAEAGGAEYMAEKDADGRIVKVTSTGMEGKQRTATFTYDEQGRLTASTSFHGEQKTWEYDDQNRLVKYVSVSDTSTSERFYTYDDQGRLVKDQNVNSRGYLYTTIREYNDAGMVVKMTDENVYPADEIHPQGQTSTETVDITYVENAKCQVNDLWAELILMSLYGGF
ncbi:MAG: hypothetical protein IJB36_00605 [Clostridia bacterium]|nr:hypothetical protein [Clostridia bacterium]